MPESLKIAETTAPYWNFTTTTEEAFVGEGIEDGGEGRGRVAIASEESLAVAFAVAIAAAAVCYTLTGASWVRRLIGYRLVSVR